MQGSQQLSGLIGPAVAGVAVALLHTGPVFAFDAVSFGVATVTIFLVVGGRRHASAQVAAEAGKPGVLASVVVGIRYAWSDPALRSLILLIAAFNFAFSGPVLVGLPFLADHVLGGGSATFGVLLSGWGFGAVVGAVVAVSIKRVPRLGTVVLSIALCMGVGLAIIGVVPNVPVALVVLAAIGLGVGFINVHILSWLQARTAGEMRGRVMSLVYLGAVGLAPISYGLAGAAVDLGPVSLMFGVAGAIVIAAALAGFASGVAGRMTYAPDA
jgi:hypothetical protein